MAILAGAHEAAPIRIFRELGDAPGDRAEFPGARQTGIVAIRARPPAPFTRMSRDHAHFESAATIPEAIDAPAEIRAFEFDPEFDVDIGIRIVARRREGDFLDLPDVNFAGLQPRTGLHGEAPGTGCAAKKFLMTFSMVTKGTASAVLG